MKGRRSGGQKSTVDPIKIASHLTVISDLHKSTHSVETGAQVNSQPISFWLRPKLPATYSVISLSLNE
ncbi:hypothetical protein PRUPE_5G141100 [Prunus persica]|uniref:Uncharacterized protein n=1 Tax=Prunus persica TaxID=3760 RepID=M5WBA4_PRUPE|nr:hypothetical protein PRUPE_5G141100 [Prunus persica]